MICKECVKILKVVQSLSKQLEGIKREYERNQGQHKNQVGYYEYQLEKKDTKIKNLIKDRE
jgi:hypothetical protein